jgi:hypothetical protein
MAVPFSPFLVTFISQFHRDEIISLFQQRFQNMLEDRHETLKYKNNGGGVGPVFAYNHGRLEAEGY